MFLDQKNTHPTPKQVGELQFDEIQQLLSSANEKIYLRHKLNEVLIQLLKSENRLVSRNELIETIWQGNYYVGEKAVTHSICHLRRVFKQLGEQSVEIRTLPKRGYQLRVVKFN